MLKLINNFITPRWIVFLYDIFISIFSILSAYLIRFNFSIKEIRQFDLDMLPIVLLVVIVVRSISFYSAKTYSGIIRYTGAKDTQKILITLIIGSVFYTIINIFTYIIKDFYLIPLSIIIIDFLLASFLLVSSRLIVKILFLELTQLPSKNEERLNYGIYGSGEFAIITKRTLEQDILNRKRITAFFDDDNKRIRKKIENIEIFHKDQLEEIIELKKINHLIISKQNISKTDKKYIIEACLNQNIKVSHVPPVDKWINGELSLSQIRNIKIEDLLEREPIKLDHVNIEKSLEGKTILITGAAGSIGSEITKQVLRFNPKRIILLDQAESPLFELEQDIIENFKLKGIIHYNNIFEVVIADIRSFERMKNVMKSFKPQVVFHAAAYKHVPLMENNPSEAILTNILGTKNIADLSVEFNVEKFIMISTDKAVNPTNVMGASKRIAEIYIQSLNNKCSTNFITTRFGNVLGSNGSVIPRFRKQIEEGGPLTVTHPEITRFFMTIPEACQLVLEASSFGKGGEIFIFDMGKSVKIVDLAKKMIKLSGLKLDKDIKIVFTGLRPGEKLYEELLTEEENIKANTHHPQIMIANVQEYDFELVTLKVNHLISLFDSQDNIKIVSAMKEIVPEFISQNSEFEKLNL